MKTLEIRWPTVALVALVVAGIVAVFAFAGPDERSDLLGILAVLGTAGAAVMRAAFGAEPKPSPKRVEAGPASRPQDVGIMCSECGTMPYYGHSDGCSKRDDDDPGAGGGEVLAVPTGLVLTERDTHHAPSRLQAPCSVATLLAVSAAALLFVGCSPSALQTHATTALVASHTLEVTRDSALSTCIALRDTCAADLACVERTRADCLAVADAQDVAVAAVSSYVDAVEIAALADEGRVMEALRFALEAAASAWAELGARLAVVGIALPSLEVSR